MSAGALLASLAAIFARTSVPYMIAGSFASSLHGEPRTTHDLDVVIDPTPETFAALIAALHAEAYYADPDTARDALARRTMFNAIAASGWKVDFIVRRARPFSVSEFARRQPARLFEVDVLVATVEDTILAKLEWAAAGGSERQLRDVAGMVAVAGDALDRSYLERWLDELGVRAAWRRLIDG